MASVKTKFTVGLFVAVGFFLAAVAIIWLGMSHYFEKGHFCVAYFDESVQGLSKDSPVKYRGVSVGRVYRLGVAPDATLIEAVLQIDPAIVNPSDMVAQLKNVGITGSMFIDLDRKKPGDQFLSPRLSFKPPYPVVATRPSQIKEFLGDVREILNNFKQLNLQALAAEISATLGEFRSAVREARIPAVSDKLRTALDRLTPLLDQKKWNRVLGAVGEAADAVKRLGTSASCTAEAVTAGADDFRKLLTSVRPGLTRAVTELQAAMQSARTLLQDTDGRLSSVQYHLVETLSNLNQATIALNRFLDLIADQPSQLLFGKPPPPRRVGKDNGSP